MTGFVAASSLLGAAGLNALGSNTLFKSSNTRTIVGKDISFYAPCNITEISNDDYVITDHPTEMGARISDHMYALPRRVEINMVYSVSGNFYLLKTVGAAFGIGSKPPTIKQYYDNFLKLQSNKELIDITTGKRQYKNMVIESISNITDVNYENSLRLTIRARELIIVKSKVTNTNSNDPNLSGTANAGTVQAK
jgi:hypothetical protein